MSTGATISLIIGFALLLAGFVVIAVPARYQDDRDTRRSMAGVYGLPSAPARTYVAAKNVAAAALVVGTILVIGSQILTW